MLSAEAIGKAVAVAMAEQTILLLIEIKKLQEIQESQGNTVFSSYCRSSRYSGR